MLFMSIWIWTVADWRGSDPQRVARNFLENLQVIGIPAPSLLTDTGRGLAAIWLIDEMPAKALKRWQSVMSVLTCLFRFFGADPASTDASRVFRLPGTINQKCGREVKVIDGTLRRYLFDDLADCIYVAAGRPTRDQLKARKKHKAKVEKPSSSDKPARPRGLPPALRFKQIRSDLTCLCEYWGGSVPEGLRNTWLHLYATCLTQEHEITDLEADVRDAAAMATPGLVENEVQGVIKSALRRAEASYASNPALDGRLHYSGATIAGLLNVSDALAQQLDLQQVFSAVERARRRAEKATARRRANGAQSRVENFWPNTTFRSANLGLLKEFLARHGIAGDARRRSVPINPAKLKNQMRQVRVRSKGACQSERPGRPPQAGFPTKKPPCTPIRKSPKKSETGRKQRKSDEDRRQSRNHLFAV